ncbi:MAG: bifunctional alpha/beta hydrolase/OsmC family protein [Rhodanobacteraceae bacterium]
MTQVDTHFETKTGHVLTGTVVQPAGPMRAVALFAHCFTCTSKSRAAVRVTNELARLGIATLRFDFTGLGSSEGDFASAGFPNDVEDLIAAADHLASTIGAPQLLIGHSLGGAAVLAAAARIPSTRAVATIGAPSDVGHVLQSIQGDLDAIEAQGSGEVSIGGRPFSLSAKFLQTAREADILKAVHALQCPLLIAHAPRDAIVGIDHARRLFDAARHPKTFLSLDDADHLLLKDADARYVARMVASWADRYLEPLPQDERSGPGTVLAVNRGPGLAVAINVRSHGLIADEPRDVGEDAGPTPYELLLASLGACTAMTVRVIARREDIPLESVDVSLSHQRDHARDCDHCDTSDAHVQAIHLWLRLTGDMTEAQRARLVEVAGKCPVRRTITGDLHVHEHTATADD